MLLRTKYQLLGSTTTLVLALAALSYPAFAQAAADAVTSNPDASVTNYGRAGGQAHLSTQPTQPPQVLTDAYQQTKAFVEHTYEKSKEFLVESAQGRASQERAAQGEVEAQKPITSGGGIGAFGRAGTQSSLSMAPREVPQPLSNAYENTKAYVKNAYEKTKEFLTESTQRPTSKQPSSLSGA